ncbi:MAG: PQQ-binding-like beta-propeller repeat protein, partial [Planctomycetes bacterium]|nr:PQQ-binding-like beta-propeller repeat protein [Planctomycetota bacterium]
MRLLWTYQVPRTRLSSPVAMESSVLVADEVHHRIDAVNVETGERKWSFVADGPITGSPVIANGMCVFGCRDGWVYAVRLNDGTLTWRNLAAPEERQIVVFGQLESVWPSLGPVTVADGTVCAVASRSAKLRMDSSQTVVVRLVTASTRLTTPVPTNTSLPTAPPLPTPTPTAIPTALRTAIPTSTAVPVPTAKPSPVASPTPSPVPTPSVT